MKLRIRGDSVRIRLTQGDVLKLARGEKVEQSTAFSATSILISSVQASAHAQTTTATFANGEISLKLPLETVRKWANSDQVGLEAEQPWGGNRRLHILVEKDFECLQPHGESQADAYPNPKKAETRDR